METVFVVLNYYELPHYYLNVFGGFSICFIITLYLQSYIFQFCSWHRVPIHYVLLSNIIALIDTYNHEKNHVEMHICKEFGIDPYSEKAAYLSGQLAKKLFKAQLKNWIK